jgi:phosphoglycolate phosphatase-like HAD superfamily hydrolase
VDFLIYVFDLDGTLCSNTNGDYDSAEPLVDRIKYVNELYEDHTVVIQTARGMTRANGNQELADTYMRELTEDQLNKWDVKFHKLYFGKCYADVYIDDKSIHDESFFMRSN